MEISLVNIKNGNFYFVFRDSLYWQPLKNNQPKIILMTKRHILGKQILLLFTFMCVYGIWTPLWTDCSIILVFSLIKKLDKIFEVHFWYLYVSNYILNIFYWLCYYSSPIFSPLFPSALHILSYPHSPHILMYVGCTYKFFGFYIFYIILNLPLSIFYLPSILLIPCMFFPISCLPFPTDNLPCYHHFADSVPVLVVCLGFGF